MLSHLIGMTTYTKQDRQGFKLKKCKSILRRINLKCL